MSLKRKENWAVQKHNTKIYPAIWRLKKNIIELDDTKNAPDATDDFQVTLYSPEPATRADLPQ